MRYQGIVFRAHDPRWGWSPVSGEGARIHGGRFNRQGLAALYTSVTPVTAMREAGLCGLRPQPILLCAYEVDAEPVLDARDPAERAAAGATALDLSCPDWEQRMLEGRVPASQKLADRLIAAGYVGMLAPSFAAGSGADDLNLVLWRWADRRPSRVALIDDEGRLTR
ncbi:MAG: RES domain-containing protein [Spirochaetaceae bacterium]|nr:RES domain-containing protein [Spirochaetaceae bacterium]